MKPTRQAIIEMARKAGAPDWWIGVGPGGETDGNATVWLTKFASEALDRFGASGGKPVAFRIPEPDIPGKHHYYDVCEVREIPTNVQLLYTHPSPADLRAEYLRGLEDAKAACQHEAYKLGNELMVAHCADAIEALKGNQ